MLKALPTCPSCGAPASAGTYCGQCGEPLDGARDYSVRAFLREAWQAVSDVDNKLYRSLWLLLARPGQLTVEWLAGRHKQQLHPLKLFLLVNLVFFVLSPRVLFDLRLQNYMNDDDALDLLRSELVRERVAERDVGYEEYAASFNRVLEVQRKVLVLLLVPVYAAALALLYWRSRRYYIEHVVFSTHYLAALLLHMTVILPVLLFLTALGLRLFGALSGLGPPGAAQNPEWLKALLVIGPAAAYLWLAQRRAYAPARGLLARSIILAALIAPLFDAYKELLFFAVYPLV